MAKMVDICVINGPNLNMLGMREPEVYGSVTLADIEKKCREQASHHKMSMDWFQSNSETVLIEEIHRCVGRADWIIINAAGSHTSVALRDAYRCFWRCHRGAYINIHKREVFRHTSLIAGIAHGVIARLQPRLILHGS